MVNITATSQLNVFDTIKTLLTANSTLSIFDSNNSYYDYEPAHKNGTSFPYFVVKLPDTDHDIIIFDNKTKIKDYVVEIMMVNEFIASANVKTYAGAVLDAIEGGDSSFTALGYKENHIEVTSSERETIDSNEFIVTTFELTLTGATSRD